MAELSIEQEIRCYAIDASGAAKVLGQETERRQALDDRGDPQGSPGLKASARTVESHLMRYNGQGQTRFRAYWRALLLR